MPRMHRCLFALLLLCLALPAAAQAPSRTLTVASTTSTQDSGLFEFILPLFQARTGIAVRVIAQGTGQALDTGRRGDADVVFVHARAAEEKFVADGFAAQRYPVMYNDFILVGPAADPAGVRGGKDVAMALRAIRDRSAPFVSRGDRSGTHIAELALWQSAGIDIAGARGWYREIGQGMGAALNTAAAMGAYVLTDRATWLAFKNPADLVIAVQGDRRLFNQYGVMLVSPTKHPHVKRPEGEAFIAWLTGPEGQAAVASYKIAGQQLFVPNAGDDE